MPTGTTPHTEQNRNQALSEIYSNPPITEGGTYLSVTQKSIQDEIAREAASYIFPGNVAISSLGDGTVKVKNVVKPDMSGLEDAIKSLQDKTDRGGGIDPFEWPDDNAWVILGKVLSQYGSNWSARTLMLRYLDTCYELQKKYAERIHKGPALYWVAEKEFANGRDDQSKSYALLAFIEDCMHKDVKDPKQESAYKLLTAVLGVSTEKLDPIIDFSRNQGTIPLHPELVLVRWKRRNTIPIDLVFNPHFVLDQISEIEKGADQTGKTLEVLAAYLMMAIPHFEVMHEDRVKGGQLDVLVRNDSPLGEPFRWLGDYFLIECKDLEGTVTQPQFGHFVSKMMLNKAKQGAIISRKGLADWPPKTNASKDRGTVYAQSDVVVLDILLDDLKPLRSSDDLLAMMQSKYEELRFK